MTSVRKRIRTFSILPRSRPPILASRYRGPMPIRARRFCQPVRGPNSEGFLFYPLVDFEFRCRDDRLELRAPREGGEVFTTAADPDNAASICVGDVSRAWEEECLAHYRMRVEHEQVPETFSRELPTYPDTLVHAHREEPPYGYFLQVWLGLAVTLDEGETLFLTDPAALQFADRGFEQLDAVIEADRWHGYLNALIRPTRFDEWVTVSASEPICQGLVYSRQRGEVVHTALEQTPQDVFMNPLRWHVLDAGYRNPPGKYQRQMGRAGSWDCTWRTASEGKTIELPNELRIRLADKAVSVIAGPSADEVSIHLAGGDALMFDARLGALARGIATGEPFTIAEACAWVRTGEPDSHELEAKVHEYVHELLARELLVVDG